MPEFVESTVDMDTKIISDLELVLTGQENCEPSHSYGPAVRPFELIHFVTRGKGRLQTGSDTFEIGKGDVFLIAADHVSYYEADRYDPWAYSWIGFAGVRAQPIMRQIMMAAEGGHVLHDLDTEKYAALIDRAAYLKDANIENYYLANSVLLHVLSCLVSDLSAVLAFTHRPVLAERVKYYLDIRYAEHIRLGALAELFDVHPNYLTRAFRERYGISPKQYLTDLKLKKAAHMLVMTDLPVSVIASSVGFDDQAAFSKMFRAHYKSSPAAYRRLCANDLDHPPTE